MNNGPKLSKIDLEKWIIVWNPLKIKNNEELIKEQWIVQNFGKLVMNYRERMSRNNELLIQINSPSTPKWRWSI